MTTRLFLCDRKQYPGVYDEVLDATNSFRKKQQHRSSWTCGNMVNISVGDTAYFVRVNDKMRGVFASGTVIAPPNKGVIDYRWEALVSFDNPLLISDIMQRLEFKGANFALRGSGYRLGDKYTRDLHILWQQHVDKYGVRG